MPSPDQIGRYRVDRRLGSGAFAVVWLAHDDRLEAPVAVKVMAENWAYRVDIRERFLAEARLLRKATAGGVVQVFDVGEMDDERPYFVMEYADRGTVADRMAEGPLHLNDALRLTAEAARGTQALHEAGVVHRDIKPSNVLLAGGGTAGRERVLVADLGLAKNLAQASGLTVVAGSSGYMAPEQAEPFDGIDARADVYSLGGVLYHLVTGKVPGPPGKVLPVDQVRPEIPPQVSRAVERAMEPDRERRWKTAAAFADALDRIGGMETKAAEAAAAGQTGTVELMVQRRFAAKRRRVAPQSPAPLPPPTSASQAPPASPGSPGPSSSSEEPSDAVPPSYGSQTPGSQHPSPSSQGSPSSHSSHSLSKEPQDAVPPSHASPVPDPSSRETPRGTSQGSPVPGPPSQGSPATDPSSQGASPVPSSTVPDAPSPAPEPPFPEPRPAWFQPPAEPSSGASPYKASGASSPVPEPASPAPEPTKTWSTAAFRSSSPEPPPPGPRLPASERDTKADDSSSSKAASPRSRKGRRWLVLGLAVVVLAASGVGAVWLKEQGEAPPNAVDDVRVKDSTGRISVKVPGAWAEETVNSGWNPAMLGLSGQHAPGLTIAQDVSRWQDLTASVSGVFVGVGSGKTENVPNAEETKATVADKVGRISHSGCSYTGSRDVKEKAWRGKVRSWSSCDSPGHSLEEIGLASTRRGGPSVYMQIRCDEDCSVRTEQVVESLRVSAAGRKEKGGS
ncbi:serine/threonine-protein kinase [Streptomyces sp. NBC_01187]|uniref:serine/threonine-protein kinase n=1 Tax=Streptomyces sp. NBC_01187 TaxID=2903766 RepID=UPI0038680C7D